MCVFTVVNSDDYNSALWLCVCCVCVGGPALSGYMSLSKPPSTCRGWISSCMLARVSSGPATYLLTQTSKQAVSPCVWVMINKWSLSAHKENAIRLPSSPRQQFVLPTDLPGHAPIKSYIWYCLWLVLWGAHAIVLWKSHSIFWLQSALFIYFSFPLLPPCASHLTAALTTCCPSWLLWLYAASVLSWCLSALLWRSSFMKGESSTWKNTSVTFFFFVSAK